MTPTLTLTSLADAIALAPPAPDKLELRVRDWRQIPTELQNQLVRSGVEIRIDARLPPGIVVQRNLTRESNLRVDSCLEDIEACVAIIDLRSDGELPDMTNQPEGAV